MTGGVQRVTGDTQGDRGGGVQRVTGDTRVTVRTRGDSYSKQELLYAQTLTHHILRFLMKEQPKV